MSYSSLLTCRETAVETVAFNIDMSIIEEVPLNRHDVLSALEIFDIKPDTAMRPGIPKIV